MVEALNARGTFLPHHRRRRTLTHFATRRSGWTTAWRSGSRRTRAARPRSFARVHPHERGPFREEKRQDGVHHHRCASTAISRVENHAARIGMIEQELPRSGGDLGIIRKRTEFQVGEAADHPDLGKSLAWCTRRRPDATRGKIATGIEIKAQMTVCADRLKIGCYLSRKGDGIRKIGVGVRLLPFTQHLRVGSGHVRKDKFSFELFGKLIEHFIAFSDRQRSGASGGNWSVYTGRSGLGNGEGGRQDQME